MNASWFIPEPFVVVDASCCLLCRANCPEISRSRVAEKETNKFVNTTCKQTYFLVCLHRRLFTSSSSTPFCLHFDIVPGGCKQTWRERCRRSSGRLFFTHAHAPTHTHATRVSQLLHLQPCAMRCAMPLVTPPVWQMPVSHPPACTLCSFVYR